MADKAADQARRKAAWVKQNWELVTGDLGEPLTGATTVIGLVVSRYAALPLHDHAAASISTPQIREVVTDLRELPQAQWRPDFIRATV